MGNLSSCNEIMETPEIPMEVDEPTENLMNPKEVLPLESKEKETTKMESIGTVKKENVPEKRKENEVDEPMDVDDIETANEATDPLVESKEQDTPTMESIRTVNEENVPDKRKEVISKEKEESPAEGDDIEIANDATEPLVESKEDTTTIESVGAVKENVPEKRKEVISKENDVEDIVDEPMEIDEPLDLDEHLDVEEPMDVDEPTEVDDIETSNDATEPLMKSNACIGRIKKETVPVEIKEEKTSKEKEELLKRTIEDIPMEINYSFKNLACKRKAKEEIINAKRKKMRKL